MPEQQMRCGCEILGELSNGGHDWGSGRIVYKARDHQLNRFVVLKTVAPDLPSHSTINRHLIRESQLLAAVQHPNVVALHGVMEEQGQIWLIMEFVDEGSLTELLNGVLWPFDRAARLMEALARGVHAVHQLGIIHRDITPEHVLLTQEGQPKLIGFGRVRRFSDGTGQGVVVGTPAYLSPELACGDVAQFGPWSDVWSLGVILYELLTGKPPFWGNTILETLRKVIEAKAMPLRQSNQQVPPDLETICLKCLEKDPQRRYRSSESLANDLSRFLLMHCDAQKGRGG
jgi:serine/threonine protein kinase